jgi:hypothetical protein
MKKKIAIMALLTTSIMPANADVYVKVDANGNAIGQAIVCDAETCGAGSEYSKLTLKEGESYVLQGRGTTGIGNNSPDVIVKVDIPTQVWTITPSNPVFVAPIITDTSTVITDTATVLSDTATAITETTTATMKSTTLESLYAQIMALLTQILALIAKLNG